MSEHDIKSIIDRALGGATGTEEEPISPTTLDQLIGDWFADVDTGFVGVLSKNLNRRTGATTYNLSDMTGNSIRMPVRMMSTTTRMLYSTAGRQASPQGKLTESDIKRIFGVDTAGGGGGGGGSAPAYSSTRQAAQEQMAFETAEAEKTRAYNTAIEKARLEAERISNLRSEMNDLRQARISERVGARRDLTQIAGEDTFRTLGSLRARAVQGPTILDQFKTELGQAASFQEPMIGPNASISDLESAITKLAQPILPQGGAASAFRPPGLEHGGTVSKEEVQPFSMGRPHPKTAIEFAKKAGMTTVMTGERTGGPELVIGKEFTVIPLTDEEEDELMNSPIPKALTGAEVAQQQFGVTGTGPNYGLEGFQDLLTSLRKRAGVTGPFTGGGTGDFLSRLQASALGAYQAAPGTLLKQKNEDWVYQVDETGRLRRFENPDVFFGSGNKDFSNVQEIWPEQLANFEMGDRLTSPFTLPSGGLGTVGALGSPLTTKRGFMDLFTAQGLSSGTAEWESNRLSQLIGFLPAPHKIGAIFNRLLPAEQSALISAYRLAGIPAADLQAIADRSGIQGRARGPIFTG